MLKYSKEQLNELYKSLPEELQNALYSEQNGKNIKEICEEKNIKDNKDIFEINKYVGYVLFGLLSPNKLSSLLEKELKIDKDSAEQINNRINNSIFLPIKDVLEPLYGIDLKAKIVKKTEKGKSPATVKRIDYPIKEKKSNTENKSEKEEDRYRESII